MDKKKLKALLISDTHGLHRRYETQFLNKITNDNIDIIIHAGDMSNVGTITQISEFLSWFGGLDRFKYKLFIGGNHDFGFDKEPHTAEAMIPDNIIYLNNSSIKIEGIKFWGSPITPTFYNWAFMADRGYDISKYWEMIPNDIDVLITHGPPYGILDYIYNNNEHVGCKDLFIALDRIRPKFHIFGHIHNSYGVYETETCVFYNASVLDDAYRVVRTGHLIKI